MALHLLVIAALVLLPASAAATTPVEAAQALVARYHEDLSAVDRARELLEEAVRREERLETLIALSYVSFLWGDVRAATTADKLAAYDRGREVGRRAVERAPDSHDAHLWYAINTGRWGQTKGIFRSLALLPTVREEIDVLLALDPRSPRAHTFAGNVFLELPRVAGGDPGRAEMHFRRALDVDPGFTVARVGLARAHIAAGRYGDAGRELQRVIDERTPTLVADWTVKDLPRARALLASIRDRL
jgi:tetratricopeptide (TPR) repeat protein